MEFVQKFRHQKSIFQMTMAILETGEFVGAFSTAATLKEELVVTAAVAAAAVHLSICWVPRPLSLPLTWREAMFSRHSHDRFSWRLLPMWKMTDDSLGLCYPICVILDYHNITIRAWNKSCTRICSVMSRSSVEPDKLFVVTVDIFTLSWHASYGAGI